MLRILLFLMLIGVLTEVYAQQPLPEPTNLKEDIKYFRMKNSLSIAETAEKLGLSKRDYFNFEVRAIWPKTPFVDKMCQLFDCNIAYDDNRQVRLIQRDSVRHLDPHY